MNNIIVKLSCNMKNFNRSIKKASKSVIRLARAMDPRISIEDQWYWMFWKFTSYGSYR